MIIDVNYLTRPPASGSSTYAHVLPIKGSFKYLYIKVCKDNSILDALAGAYYLWK